MTLEVKGKITQGGNPVGAGYKVSITNTRSNRTMTTTTPSANGPGTYANAYFGPAEVVADEDRLELLLGPDLRALPLTHWDGDTFVAYPVTENQPAGSVSRVDFVIDDASGAASVTVEHLNEMGMGTFDRAE